MFDEFSRDPLFDDGDMRKLEKKIYERRGKNLVKADIRETGTEYELEMDLPEFKRNEIRVSLRDGYLTICAAKGLDEDEQEKNSGRYIRQECCAGACEGSFYVGGDVTGGDIKGEFRHGIPKLLILKKDAKSLTEEEKYIPIGG